MRQAEHCYTPELSPVVAHLGRDPEQEGDDGATSPQTEPTAEDADLISICAQMIGIAHTRIVIAAADEYAPDEGPLHDRYARLHTEWCALGARLLRARAPVTLGGVLAMAKLALVEAIRDGDDAIEEPPDILAWITRQAVVWAAGEDEAVPPPRSFPVDWPGTAETALADAAA